jgi:hypothetical protein
MQTHQHSDESEFWSDVYCGRPIAVFNHYGRWLVYLDHVLQSNVVFETAENAILWLTDRVDAGIPARLN